MKKYLLFALMLSGIISGAQPTDSSGNCKAQFKYRVNDMIMSPVAATAINFDDRSEGNVTAWFWDFGDGNKSQEQNPMNIFIHPVPSPTTKFSPYRTVVLTVLTSDGCKSSYSEMINIMDGTTYPLLSCKAEFKYYQASYDSLVGKASFQMTNLSVGDSLSYFWKFEDGTTSTEKDPIVIFDIKPSEHQASLTVTGKNNCTDTFYEIIKFTDPNTPVIDPFGCYTAFGYSVNYSNPTLLPALVLDFYSKATPEAIEWNWDFGDGTTSNEQNPTHIFNFPVGNETNPGEPNPFTKISLIVKTVTGCEANYSEYIDLYMNTIPVDPQLPCSARYKYHQTSLDSIAGTVSFEFNSYPAGDSLTYSWFFDNGLTSTEKEPVITFDIKQLPMMASLTVQGKNNCTDTFWDAVYFEEPIIYPWTDDSTQCFTIFGYQPNYTVKTFAPALVLDFYAQSPPDAIAWNWDFGDGTTSADQNPLHIFNLPLVQDSILSDPNPFRNVCLTVTTATGCVSSWCETIDIYMNTTPPDPSTQCHAWFKAYRPSDMVSIPEVIPYQFVDGSEGNVISWFWQFEDGTSSTEAAPLVNFDFMKTTQKVSLTIQTADSCSSTWTDVIYISNYVDSSYVSNPVNYYTMKVTGNFPIEMSSCAGTAHAQVFLNDSLVSADNYTWSTGEQGQDVKGLCPTQTYSIKAITTDGNSVSSTFVFNSDGTVSEIPTYWYITGGRDNWQIQYDLNNNKNFTIEWRLCDGTIVQSDSIPLGAINCGNAEPNMIMKDAAGNVVYTENISLKTLAPRIKSDLQISATVKLFPNPVNDVLNIKYSGTRLNEMQIEICDITGKSVSIQKISEVESGQQIGLNVSSLRKGIYLCKMTSGSKLIGLEKFIK